jgi:hypothetical protein
MTAGQAVVEALRAEGVKYVFGVVGGTFLEVLDALYDRSDIKFVSVRHEQGGAFMADGFARAAGAPGVCLVTSGPGATNLVTGVYAAYVGHSPVIAKVRRPGTSYRDAPGNGPGRDVRPDHEAGAQREQGGADPGAVPARLPDRAGRQEGAGVPGDPAGLAEHDVGRRGVLAAATLPDPSPAAG